MTKKTEDYEESEAMAVAAGKAEISPEFKDRVVGRSGLFAEVIENSVVYPNFYKLETIDGSGTKLMLCSWLDRWETEGKGLVAMCMNDMATFGNVMPDTADFYFACQTPVEEQKMGHVMRGINNALKECILPGVPFHVNIAKCETASLDEMICGPVPGMGFDAAMQASGFIRRSEMPEFSPEPGDVIVGFASSGLNNNGYTSARHVLLRPEVEPRSEWKSQYNPKGFSLHDKPPGFDQSIGEALLTPTPIYLRAMQRIGRNNLGAFGVNITGYGLKNFNRFGDGVDYEITDPLPTLPVHNLMAEMSGYPPEKAYEKLNMGMGFAVIVPDEGCAEVAIRNAADEGLVAKRVGRVVARDGPGTVTLLHHPYSKRPIPFEGYGSS